jgi:hypothetical protein
MWVIIYEVPINLLQKGRPVRSLRMAIWALLDDSIFEWGLIRRTMIIYQIEV